MTRVIAVANQKGGVGKTTSSVNIATCLTQAGLSAVVVDLDPQCNASGEFGVDPETSPATMYEVLAPRTSDRVSLDEAVFSTSYGPKLLIGSDALADVDQHGGGPGSEQLLAVQFQRSRVIAEADVVFIDCPPSLGRLTVMALLAADDVLTPVGVGYNDLGGLARLMDTVERVADNNGRDDLAVKHVLVSGFDGRTQLSKDVARTVRGRFADEYLGVVHQTVRVGEASARAQPVVVYEPDCTASEDYREISTKLTERIKG